MQKKTIKKVLKKKFDEWVKSITDKSVRKLVQDNTIITGGSIASMLLKEKVNDYDIYFTNKETVLAVSRYYVAQFNKAHGDTKNRFGYVHKAFVLDGALPVKDQIPSTEKHWRSRMLENITEDRVRIIVRSDGVAKTGMSIDEFIENADEISLGSFPKNTSDTDKEENKYQVAFMSTNAITLTNKIQLVIRFYGDPEEIHENYDFVHATNYWLSGSNELVLRLEALESLMARCLYYQGSKYPLCSVIRTRKFIKRDWRINAGEYLKMCFQLSELDLKDIDVLEDQLFGVDTVYFMNLISALREHTDKNPDFELDSDYVVSLVDRIFGE